VKTKLTETKCESAIWRAGQLFSRVACLGAVILMCSSASAQNLIVSGRDAGGGEIFKFTWDGRQGIFASGLYRPWDVAFDRAGNLFVVDYGIRDDVGIAAIYKITPNGIVTIFASRLSYPSELAVDGAGKVFVADYDNGSIYVYKPDGSRATFASGLYHPAGMAFDNAGNLFVVDNNIGNIYQGSIYEYNPDGSRFTIAELDPSDRPAGLAFDRLGNLFMADLGGKIYRYTMNGVLRRYARTTFGSVGNSAQSLTFDNAGNLFVVDAGDAKGRGNAVYKFTAQGARIIFAPRQPVNDIGQAGAETFSHVAFQPVIDQ